LIFAIPNGGARDGRTGRTLKEEGVLAGVADICILAKGKTIYIEFKTDKGTQRNGQKEFQSVCEHQGIPYIIVRSIDEFIDFIEKYLAKLQ
jgi:hypothetical protein